MGAYKLWLPLLSLGGGFFSEGPKGATLEIPTSIGYKSRNVVFFFPGVLHAGGAAFSWAG